jgi:hypothetical protein
MHAAGQTGPDLPRPLVVGKIVDGQLGLVVRGVGNYTHTRPESQRQQIEQALRRWPASLAHACKGPCGFGRAIAFVITAVDVSKIAPAFGTAPHTTCLRRLGERIRKPQRLVGKPSAVGGWRSGAGLTPGTPG